MGIALLVAQTVGIGIPTVIAAPIVPAINVSLNDGGVAAGSYSGFSGQQGLTAAGTTDWAMWGSTSTSLGGDVRKDGGTGISTLTDVIGSPARGNTVLQALGNCCNLHVGSGEKNSLPFAFSWSGGTPTSASPSKGALAGLTHASASAPMLGYGFSFTVPVQTARQRLTIWVDANNSSGQLNASIGSVSVTGTKVVGMVTNQGGIYTIDFSGDPDVNPTMTVNWVMSDHGANNNVANVALHAAALSPAPDFTLAAAQPNVSVIAGSSTTDGLVITAVGGLTGSVSLAGTGSVAGLTASVPSPYILGAASPTLSLTAASGLAAGSYSVTVTGTLGSLVHSLIIPVTVTTADFTIGTTPTTLNVFQGSTASTGVTIAPVGGSTGTVSLTTTPVSGLTLGLSAPSYVLGSGTAVSLTVGAGVLTVPGTYSVTVTGTLGSATHDAIVTVTVPVPGPVGVPLLTNVYSPPGSTVTLYAGHISAAPNTQYTITFESAATCPSGVFPSGGGTVIGSITITTDGLGNAFFSPTEPAATAPNSIAGVPGAREPYIAARVTGPAGQNSSFSPCVVNSPDNDAWTRALPITVPAGEAAVSPPSGTYIDQPGVGRWFKFHVTPGSSVSIDLTGSSITDYDVYLFKDIAKTYAGLLTADLVTLSATFAGSGFSGSGFSGSGFSGSGFSGSGFSGSGFSGSGFSADSYSGSGFSGSGFSGSGFSGSGFSGSGFSGSGFSGSGFSGSGFSGSGFSGSGFSPADFAAAQVYSLVGGSNHLGAANEHITVNTWTATGDFYVRVNGKNGASNLGAPFALTVKNNGSVCSNVQPSALSKPGAITNSHETIVLTDSARLALDTTYTTTGINAMQAKLSELATSTNGVVVDLAGNARVQGLQAQADLNASCVYAQNLVAQAIKDVVDAYRAGNSSATPVKYIVLAGGDSVIPYFRYPDTSSIGPEVNYFPPVLDTTPSEASLRSNYVLGQDAYGSSKSLTMGFVDFPIPDLAVGRLVESPSEISGMVQAFLDLGPTHAVTPRTSLVTGYDFIADNAVAVKGNLDAGTGQAGTSLISNYGVNPSTTCDGANPALPNCSWTADQLRSAFLDARHDINFLAGHFSANSALAADFSTVMTTADFAASATNFKNTLNFSIGCHSGYNIVDAAGIPGVTATLDWAQAFAQKQATSILGTGYQYGDSDFLAYSEKIYAEFSKQLRYGTGAVAVGDALVASKAAYLKQTPGLGDLHLKSLLESALYGLPMFGINMPSGRLSAPSAGGTVGLSSYGAGVQPAATTGLKFSDITQDMSGSVAHNKTLKVLNSSSTINTTYYSKSDGSVIAEPGTPVIPLYTRGVAPADGNGYVLRGIGFKGGAYTDSSVIPLTGAPGTEIGTAHTSFNAPVFFPTQLASPNYFDTLTGGSGTTLMMAGAQHKAVTPGSDTVAVRLYQNQDYRLFYSNSTAAGSASASPVIYGVSSGLSSGNATFVAHVTGDPSADVQQVWVTYTEPNSGLWKSFDLVRDGTDPSLWTGSKALASGTLYMVQAVNGFGGVSLSNNLGAYYLAGAAASTPDAGTLVVSTGTGTSGVYGSTRQVTATLSIGSAPVNGKLVVLNLGNTIVSGITGANGNPNGQISADIPLLAAAGDYSLSATFLGDLTILPTSWAGIFTITAAPATVVVNCPLTVPYTGAAPTQCTASATGADLNQPLLVTYAPSSVAVGTVVTASAQFYGDAGHAASSGTAQFTIAKAPLTITANSTSKTYGTAATFTGTEFTTSGLQAGDSVSGVTLTSTGAPASAPISGSPYAIVPSNAAGTGLSNYAITYVNGALTVSAGSAVVSIVAPNATYNGAPHGATASVTGDGGLSQILSTISYAGRNSTTYGPSATAPTNAGDYTATATFTDPNYVTASKSADYSIAKAALTITANSVSMTYGGSLPTLTWGATGFVNGETATVLTGSPSLSTVAASTSVGSYDITITQGTLSSANYSFSFVKGSLAINTAPLVITASSATVAFGAAIPAITPSYATFVNGDTAASLTTLPTCTTTATAGSPAGPYTTTCSGAVGGNYAISYVAGTITITKATTSTSLGIATTNGNPTPQFSDSITLSSTVTSGSAFSGTIAFTVNGYAAGSASVSSATPTATATVRLDLTKLPLGAGSWTAQAAFTPDASSSVQASSASAPLVVQPEGQKSDLQPNGSSRIDYTGGQFVWVGGISTLAATLYQSQAPEATDTEFVDFNALALTATFKLYPASCTTNNQGVSSCPAAARTWTSQITNGATAGQGIVVYPVGSDPQNLAALSAGAYVVTVTVAGNQYIRPMSATSTLVVSESGNTFISGGGYLAVDSTSNAQSPKGYFAFDTAKSSKKVTGSVAYVYRVRMDVSSTSSIVPCAVIGSSATTGCRDVDVIIRSTSFNYLNAGQKGYTTGTVTVQFVDAVTGTPYAATFGSSNGAFRLDIVDNSQQNTASGFGFSAYGSNGSLFHQAYDPGSSGIPQTGIGAITNEAIVDGGFISSHP